VVDLETLVPVLLLNHGPKELNLNAMTFEEGMEVGVVKVNKLVPSSEIEVVKRVWPYVGNSLVWETVYI